MPFIVQPIYNHRTNSIFGFEALYAGNSRPNDWRAVDMSMLRFLAQFKVNVPLFVNLSNETILTADEDIILAAHHLNNIFFEWSEMMVDNDIYKKIVKRLNSWGKKGLRLVIDDFGAGRDGLQRIFSVEYVTAIKLDGDLFWACDKNRFAKSFIESLVKICEKNDILTVAECIETERDYVSAKKLGVNFIQGFYIDELCRDLIDGKHAA